MFYCSKCFEKTVQIVLLRAKKRLIGRKEKTYRKKKKDLLEEKKKTYWKKKKDLLEEKNKYLLEEKKGLIGRKIKDLLEKKRLNLRLFFQFVLISVCIRYKQIPFILQANRIL